MLVSTRMVFGFRLFALTIVVALWLPESSVLPAYVLSAWAREPLDSEKPVPDWYVKGVAAALLDPTPGAANEVLGLPGVMTALITLASTDSDQNKNIVVGALLKLVSHPDFEMREKIAAALATITEFDPRQRNAAVEELLKLAASENTEVSVAAQNTLTVVYPMEPQQRHLTLVKLIELSKRSGWITGRTLAELTNNYPLNRAER